MFLYLKAKNALAFRLTLAASSEYNKSGCTNSVWKYAQNKYYSCTNSLQLYKLSPEFSTAYNQYQYLTASVSEQCSGNVNNVLAGYQTHE